jgi:hypothetical protein
VLDAGTLVGLLAEPQRRRVVAALVLGGSRVDDIKLLTGLDTRTTVTALNRLVDAELVVRSDDGSYFLVEEAFALAARAAAPAPDAEEMPGAPPDAAKVIRSFVRDGRLTSIPAHHGKRLVLLDVLAQQFEPGRRYTEAEVNAVLLRWHDDYAALRRYLVDDGFLDRDAGQYWRTGGTFTPNA